jgi:hypothetical protein
MVLLKASLKVIVIVAAAIPLAMVGPLAVAVEVEVLRVPEIKVAGTVFEMAGVRTLTNLSSALVHFKVQVEFPAESVAVQILMVFPEPVAEMVGVSPEISMLFFLTLIEIVETETPFATTLVVAEIVVEYKSAGVTTATGALFT